jgi:hypothetical protein
MASHSATRWSAGLHGLGCGLSLACGNAPGQLGLVLCRFLAAVCFGFTAAAIPTVQQQHLVARIACRFPGAVSDVFHQHSLKEVLRLKTFDEAAQHLVIGFQVFRTQHRRSAEQVAQLRQPGINRGRIQYCIHDISFQFGTEFMGPFSASGGPRPSRGSRCAEQRVRARSGKRS